MSASPVVLLVAIRAFITSTGVFFVRKFFAGTAAIAEFLLVTGCTDTVPTTAACSCGHKPEYRCREERPWIFLPSLFRLPASGSTTWKYQSVGGYRKSDLLGVNMSVEVFQLGCQHISQYGRSQTCGVGVDEEKQRVRA